MRRITTAFSMMLLTLVAASTQGQSLHPAPPAELKKWNIWVGDWALSGTAKDMPTGPEYKVEWSLHERWILGGFFVQVDQTWKANGQELHSLEILSYDPIKKVHASSGFSSDGSTWTLTATFEDAKVTEEGVSRGPDGQATTCRTTWVFSSDRKALSGTQECDQNGVRWTTFRVKGTKSTTTH
jgi:Protein of unknown function (DUF1579)